MGQRKQHVGTYVANILAIAFLHRTKRFMPKLVLSCLDLDPKNVERFVRMMRMKRVMENKVEVGMRVAP